MSLRPCSEPPRSRAKTHSVMLVIAVVAAGAVSSLLLILMIMMIQGTEERGLLTPSKVSAVCASSFAPECRAVVTFLPNFCCAANVLLLHFHNQAGAGVLLAQSKK